MYEKAEKNTEKFKIIRVLTACCIENVASNMLRKINVKDIFYINVGQWWMLS